MIKTINKKDGFIDCYIDMPAINDLPGAKGSLENAFIDDLTDILHNHFGVSVLSFPNHSRIQISNVIDDAEQVKRAVDILAMVELSMGLRVPRRAVDIDVEKSADMQLRRSMGQFFESERSISEQNAINNSYRILKSKGAELWEMEKYHFSVRGLKRGFFKESTESIKSISDLLEFSINYHPK